MEPEKCGFVELNGLCPRFAYEQGRCPKHVGLKCKRCGRVAGQRCESLRFPKCDEPVCYRCRKCCKEHE